MNLTIVDSPKPLTTIAHFIVDEGHPDLEGHFPGFPILPAVSQVGVVVELLKIMHSSGIAVVDIKRAKFLKMLHPTRLCSVELEAIDTHKVAWTIADEVEVYSKGILSFNLC